MAAGKVGVGEEEYASFCSQLRSTQDCLISGIESISQKIEAVNCRDGGFYVENVTPNITRLLSALEEVKSMVERMQDTENEMIDSFERIVENTDTCC